MRAVINVSQPDFGTAEFRAVQSVLESHWVGMGPQTAAFELAVAQLLKVRHVIATASCTSALHLALTALDRDGRDEVILPSLTFVATVQAIILAGYKPCFAEVDPSTLTIDCADVARLMSRRTRAIIPVHFAGYPCEMKQLCRLADSAGIDIIADGAHAFAGTIGGAPIGTQGTATCFSFSANKNITCGEGGAVATGSDIMASRLKKMRYLGINGHTWERRANSKPWVYCVDSPGFRYHMSDINAAIGLAQLKRLATFTRIRRELAARYDAALAGVSNLLPIRRDLEHTVPHLYVLRVTNGFRDGLYDRLRSKGIVCGVHYIPNHLQPAFQEFKRPMPVTEQLSEELISLPLHTRLNPGQVDAIAGAITGFFRQGRSRALRGKRPRNGEAE
jgi:perosamine synthetase